MKKIFNTLDNTILGRSFLITTFLILLIVIIFSIGLLLVGLWFDDIAGQFNQLFERVYIIKNKLLVIYLLMIGLFCFITDNK